MTNAEILAVDQQVKFPLQTEATEEEVQFALVADKYAKVVWTTVNQLKRDGKDYDYISNNFREIIIQKPEAKELKKFVEGLAAKNETTVERTFIDWFMKPMLREIGEKYKDQPDRRNEETACVHFSADAVI